MTKALSFPIQPLVMVTVCVLVSACDYSFEEGQSFDLRAFDATGYILDIGGGGEGVIGRLKGHEVIAIDISQGELADAPAGPLKVVMDASDLKFVDASFDSVTSFCTMMYIDEALHERVFQEVFRVLRPAGKYHIWDIAIPKKTEEAKARVLFPISVKLPEANVRTAYGVRRRGIALDATHYLNLARQVGFDVERKTLDNQSFYIELKKPPLHEEESDEEPVHDPHRKRPDDQIEFYEQQDIVVEDFDAKGFILDIGGGGEGVIGRLKGEQVIAVDINERELEDAPDGPVKIVMDAGDLQFLDGSFETATSFFTLMYIKSFAHESVLREIHRVLSPGGRFLIWDVVLPPAPDEKKVLAAFPLQIHLPNEEVSTGYGVGFADIVQDVSYYTTLAEKAGFQVVDQWQKNRSLYLELEK
jgi:ubiquinone/menaquinone biosynthesis C-methylase UbiE